MNWNQLLLAVISCCVVPSLADVAKVEVQVLDDLTGSPMKDVEVAGYFWIDNGWMAWKGSELPNKDVALTDVNGRCKLRGRTNCGSVGCWVEKAPSGYYVPSRGWGQHLKYRNLLGIWQPDNMVATIRLQRVGHPIPLLVKSLIKHSSDKISRDVFPLGEDTLRYDLFIGDWLPPAGTGIVCDVQFTRNPREDLGESRATEYIKGRAYRDSMTVNFPGDGNGLAEFNTDHTHKLKIRTAPEDGYWHDYTCWKMEDRKMRSVKSYDENRCFCFRIRTRRDSEGRIVEAYYGKIYDDISFIYKYTPDSLVIASPLMLYYLNPKSLDRNLEWDRKENLFQPGKRVRSPDDKLP